MVEKEDLLLKARNKASDLVSREFGSGKHAYTCALDAFAKYIAEHDEAPVDPLLAEARKIVSIDVYGTPEGHNVVWGREEATWVDYVHRGIKRGMELAREPQP